MGENGGIDGEIDLPGGSFSRLLLSVEDVEQSFVVYSSVSPPPPPLFSVNTPKMLCFGDFGSETTQPNSTDTLTYSDDSTDTTQNKKRNGSCQESGSTGALMMSQSQKTGKKKNKPEMGLISPSGHAKARREKLGERITTLQQLVSPYGKTDTASVLHEAMGYIRFLHDQVKVLSSPYLQRPPSSSPAHHHLCEKGETRGREESTKHLRSRGLCLVPVQCIVDVTKANGADFWSSATTCL